MKKLLCMLLTLVILLPMAACDAQGDDVRVPVHFYYRQAEMEYGANASVISAEVREAEGHREDYTYLMKQYLQGPESYSLYMPFPRVTTLVSIEVKDSIAYVQLSTNFSQLSGMDLSVACACITMTACEMTGAASTCISAADSTLDGNASITMSPSDILFLDDSNVVIDPN